MDDQRPYQVRFAGLGLAGSVATAGASDSGVRDYVAWHDAYDNPGSSLSKRLRAVRAEIERFLDVAAPNAVRVLSVCAGDGRDLLGVLARRPDRARVGGTLVEIAPELVDRARQAIVDLAMGAALEVRQSDAGHSDAYADAVPVDLLIVSGVMGNISAADIERLVYTGRELCAPGATVLWTRGRMEPDLGPEIRSWFDAAGFASVALQQDIEGSPMRLGVERLIAPPLPLRTGRRIFTFLRQGRGRPTTAACTRPRASCSQTGRSSRHRSSVGVPAGGGPAAPTRPMHRGTGQGPDRPVGEHLPISRGDAVGASS